MRNKFYYLISFDVKKFYFHRMLRMGKISKLQNLSFMS